MNLLFLVEGRKAEPKIYRAWLAAEFPNLEFVNKPEDMTVNCCRIIPGNGYPNMFSPSKLDGTPSKLEACLLDIQQYENIDHFFICLDAEEESYGDRLATVEAKLQNSPSYPLVPQKTTIHIVIQVCCIETWLLGNTEVLNSVPSLSQSEQLLEFFKYYDVRLQDPEIMGKGPELAYFLTKAQFHKRYFKEYIKQVGKSYSEKQNKVVANADYWAGLQTRCQETQHLGSLQNLMQNWQKIKN